MNKREQKLHARGGKVLQFEQPGDFFYKLGLEKLDENNLPDAMAYYNRALSRDPSSRETRLAMAEVLTQMGRYEESNRILFALLRTKEPESECYFGMSCNFAGLNDLRHARDSLERYLDADPEGEFIFDAYDMLDAIDDADLLENADGLISLSKEDRAYDLADDGRDLLEDDRYEEAAEAFRHALELSPKLNYARNNLSLAYFCLHDYKRAAAEARAVLRDEPENVQALCNLAMILHTTHDAQGANRIADELLAADTDEPEELNRVALVLMDMERFEDAYGVMQRLVRHYPYETGALHRTAICAYETERYAEAKACYDKLLKINPNDSIARYYRGLCRAAQTGGLSHGRKRRFMLNYQVPIDEMVARINRLNSVVSLPKAELDLRWQEDDELKNLIEWGFTLPEEGINHALLALVASFGDARAEAMLRDYALRADRADGLKHEAFAFLARMGAEEPFVGYIGGELVESRISFAKGFPSDLPKAYAEVVTRCVSAMHGRRPEAVLAAALKLWASYVAPFEGKRYPRINRFQSAAMAAALEYLACRSCGERASRADICSHYGVSALRLNNALSKLGKIKEDT